MHQLFWVCAIIQGLTEFLPISSSAHIWVAAQALGNLSPDQNFVVFLHFGSMLALVLYFRKELTAMFRNVLRFNTNNQWFKLAMQLIVALIPTLVIGALKSAFIPDLSKDKEFLLLGINSILFGVLLYWVDKRAPTNRTLQQVSYKSAFFIGLAQSVAFLEGASRSGMTITAARFLGFNRIDSTKFSFLLNIPTILAASVLKLKFHYVDIGSELDVYFLGALVSLFVSLLTITTVLRVFRHISFLPFALDRVGLGLVLLMSYFWGYT